MNLPLDRWESHWGPRDCGKRRRGTGERPFHPEREGPPPSFGWGTFGAGRDLRGQRGSPSPHRPAEQGIRGGIVGGQEQQQDGGDGPHLGQEHGKTQVDGDLRGDGGEEEGHHHQGEAGRHPHRQAEPEGQLPGDEAVQVPLLHPQLSEDPEAVPVLPGIPQLLEGEDGKAGDHQHHRPVGHQGAQEEGGGGGLGSPGSVLVRMVYRGWAPHGCPPSGLPEGGGQVPGIGRRGMGLVWW